MRKITKQNIGQICYAVAYNHITAEGVIRRTVIENVSLDGTKIKVKNNNMCGSSEYGPDRIALTYEDLMSTLTQLKNEHGDVMVPSSNGYMPYAVGFCADKLIQDEYGDMHTAKDHDNCDFQVKVPYGGRTPEFPGPEGVINHLYQAWGDSALILKYNMDKATDDWKQCPHCGGSNTAYDEVDGGGDYERLEHMYCGDCDCEWTNVYEPAKRKERYLTN